MRAFRRRAYARSTDGLTGLSFGSRAARDVFLRHVGGYEPATQDEYLAIARECGTAYTSTGERIRVTRHAAYDMTVPAYWDGWDEAYAVAHARGLV